MLQDEGLGIGDWIGEGVYEFAVKGKDLGCYVFV